MNKIRASIAVAAMVALAAGALSIGATAGARARGAVAYLEDVSGTRVGIVRLIPRDDGTVAVRAGVTAIAPTGFHGFHVHTTGTCDPQTTDPSGATVPFFSAGGHYNPDTSAAHGDHAGDLPVLLVLADGTARLRVVTDRFSLPELLEGDGSAIIVHGARDNYANIPGQTATGGERYHSHSENVFGPDSATRATGDAGSRIACGVVQRVTG